MAIPNLCHVINYLQITLLYIGSYYYCTLGLDIKLKSKSIP